MADKYLYHDLSKHFGLRVKGEREKLGLTQVQLAKKVGVSKTTIQNYESGAIPKGTYLFLLSRALKCSIDWLLVFEESPFIKKEFILGSPSGMTGEMIRKDEKGSLYNKVEMTAMHVAAPGAEYNADMDDFGRAATGLKEIFDSGDPVLIPAIQANIHAFQISARREAHIQEQTKEISDLKKRMESLEKQMKEGDRRKGERRLQDVDPPDGVDRRSGEERRVM